MSANTNDTSSPAGSVRAPKHAVAWAEIPVRDLAAAIDFYEAVLGNRPQLEESGPNPMAMLVFADEGAGCSGHLYEGRPATDGAGPTIHLGITRTVEETAEACEAAGGTLVGPVVEIPAGRFQYAIDPDGNSIGFFEAPRL